MKIRWTFGILATALVMGSFPAFAHQGLQAPTKADNEKMKRKADAAAMTPFVTKHQADTLKKVVDGAQDRKDDEKVAYNGDAGPFQPSGATTVPQGPAAQGKEQGPAADPAKAPQEAPKPEPAAPEYRLMGTVCGEGKDVAMFYQGAEWPKMMKVGDQLDPMTKIVAIARGKVTLERIVAVAQPAVEAQAATDAQPAVAAQPAQAEKKARFELYAW